MRRINRGRMRIRSMIFRPFCTENPLCRTQDSKFSSLHPLACVDIARTGVDLTTLKRSSASSTLFDFFLPLFLFFFFYFFQL